VSHELGPTFDKLREELFLELRLSLDTYFLRGNLIPVGGQNDNVLVNFRATKLAKHPQISAGLATEPRVGYPLDVYETSQLSILVIPCKLLLVHVTNGLRKIDALFE
jgi:hypothetical protein